MLDLRIAQRNLFFMALFQLVIFGMRMTSTGNLALSLAQRQLGLSSFDADGKVVVARGGHDTWTKDLVYFFYCLFEHLFLLSSILFLACATRNTKESTKVYKVTLLKRWMLVAGMYNWLFCISTAISVDWACWTVRDLDAGKLTFVILNTGIFLFVLNLSKHLELLIELDDYQEQMRLAKAGKKNKLGLYKFEPQGEIVKGPGQGNRVFMMPPTLLDNPV